MDLVPGVTSTQRYDWDETVWQLAKATANARRTNYKVVAIDYGVKRNILRLLADRGLQGHGRARRRPSAEDHPGDEARWRVPRERPRRPCATGEYSVPTIQDIAESGSADLRHLPRPSDDGAGDWRQDR